MSINLTLASSSKYRSNLLKRLGLAFGTVAADVDETRRVNESIPSMIKRLSLDKANAVAKHNPNHWVIGSDQSAQLNGHVLTKPGDQHTAIEQLKICSGKEVEFVTGVALVNLSLNQSFYDNSIVKVKFLDLTDQQIEHYVKTEKPLDCAGSFKVEGLGISLFASVKSDDPTSLEGLPLITLTQLLRQAGIDPLAQ